ncbi:MAG: hypothetical protein NTX32_04000 [Candidatus Firestonebacteria bacterium]|nr:hypothetical protein [Candidatus Firestonebacteria bacterium]
MLKFIFKTVPKAIERGIKKCFFSTLALIIKKKKVPAPDESYKKILIVLNEGALGDFIAKVALIETLKASFPKAALDVLVVRKTNKLVLDNNTSIRRIYFWETDHRHKIFFNAGLIRLALSLRKEKYDLTVTTTNDNLRFAFFCMLTGAKRSVGFTNNQLKLNQSDIFLTDTFLESGLHFVEKHKKLGAYIAGTFAVEKNPAMLLTPDELKYADDFWDRSGVLPADILLGVHPFYGPHIEKGYSAEKFKEVFELIKFSYPRLKLCIFWGHTELEGMESIKKLARGNIIIEDVDFRRLAALLRRLNLFICCNTGTSHLASLSDIPVILLCEKTLFWQFDPWGTKNAVLRTDTLYCSDITPDTVARKAVEMLKKYYPEK